MVLKGLRRQNILNSFNANGAERIGMMQISGIEDEVITRPLASGMCSVSHKNAFGGFCTIWVVFDRPAITANFHVLD